MSCFIEHLNTRTHKALGNSLILGYIETSIRTHSSVDLDSNDVTGSEKTGKSNFCLSQSYTALLSDPARILEAEAIWFDTSVHKLIAWWAIQWRNFDT